MRQRNSWTPAVRRCCLLYTSLAKCLLYAINGGVDEKSHEQCGPNYAPITSEYLTYDEVLPKYVRCV